MTEKGRNLGEYLGVCHCGKGEDFNNDSVFDNQRSIC